MVGLRQRARCFSDETLSVPARVHSDTCRGTCRCGSPGYELPPGPVRVIDQRGEAACVAAEGRLPVWVEAELIVRVSTPVAPKALISATPPPDHHQLMRWIAEQGTPSYGRRRRAPAFGEIVWIRTDLRGTTEDPSAYRLLSVTVLEGRGAALLIDPEVPAASALSVSWEEIRQVDLGDKTAAQVLVPAFPLPDGSPSEGWT